MPQPNVRHGRNAWDWGGSGGRSELDRAAAADDPDPARRPPGRKDRSACKRNHGQPHEPHLVFAPYLGRLARCRWWPSWRNEDKVAWHCGHREVCRHCGKVLRDCWHLAPEECPAYPGSPEQRAEAEAELARWEERRRRWGLRRKPVITGRQGYRRPKAGQR